MLRSDAARLLPEKAREIIERAERSFSEVLHEIKSETPERKAANGIR